MQKHTKIYIQSLGLDINYPIYSELSGQVANDIHHINARGMGGTTDPVKDSIFNLMALTREEHIKYGDKKQYKEWLKIKHLEFLMKRGVKLLRVYQQVNFDENKIVFMS